jgi:citrate/tricarballylate utilization protein
MYTAPHEFAIDIPQLLSAVRVETYRDRSFPRVARRLFGGANGFLAFGVALVALSALLAAIAASGRWQELALTHLGPGAFYAVVPFLWMVVPAVILSLASLVVLFATARTLVRDVAPAERPGVADLLGALRDGLELVYLKGGGGGCYYPDDDSPSPARRVLHIVLVLGVSLAFAATLVAAVMQDLLGIPPPFAFFSAPVVLGTLGGILMLAGSIGLLALKGRSSARKLEAGAMVRLDVVFLALLALVGATGLLLLAARATPFMGSLLVVHLAAIAALFVTAPYGKFMHFPLRLAALLIFRLEEKKRA